MSARYVGEVSKRWKFSNQDHREATRGVIESGESVWGNGCEVRNCLKSSVAWVPEAPGSPYAREVCDGHFAMYRYSPVLFK